VPEQGAISCSAVVVEHVQQIMNPQILKPRFEIVFWCQLGAKLYEIDRPR
jgi:hypothetical protein